MSPSGGPGARRLRGAPGLVLLAVTCTCGESYEVPSTAIDLARCPNKRCQRPTREVYKA
jgi:hypothetical protein